MAKKQPPLAHDPGVAAIELKISMAERIAESAMRDRKCWQILDGFEELSMRIAEIDTDMDSADMEGATYQRLSKKVDAIAGAAAEARARIVNGCFCQERMREKTPLEKPRQPTPKSRKERDYRRR
jgi:hypothetical protein